MSRKRPWLLPGKDDLLDTCNTNRPELTKLVDPRFTLTRFIRNLDTGDIVAYVDFLMNDGKTAASQVLLYLQQLKVLTADQIIQYLKMQVTFANDALKDFIDHE